MAIVRDLKEALDRLYLEFDRGERISDPIERVRPFLDPADAEIVAFFAAGLAFGRVASILASIDGLLGVMGSSPAAFVKQFDPVRDTARFDRVGHRWIRGRDLAAIVWILKHVLASSGSLQQCFLEGDDPTATDIGPGLERFCRRARTVDLSPVYGRVPARPGAHGFFAQPSSGSACKRLNLFLRWMVRRDAIDLGAWTRVSPSRLIVPLDVHVIRVGRCLGLTKYRSPGWRMAADITNSLRAIDPSDPVRYDFALCHVGMRGLCGFNQPAGDSRCPLRGACRPHARRPPSSHPPSDRR